MSVQTQIDRISGAVSAALAALAEKGVTVPDGTKVDGLAALIEHIQQNNFDGGAFVKVGEMQVGYTENILNLTSWPFWDLITIDDIYIVPLNFIVTQNGSITGGTYNFVKSYNNGVLYAKRESVPGQVGIAFDCEIYVHIDPKSLNGIGRIIKIGESLALKSGTGVSINVKEYVADFSSLSVNNFYLDLRRLDIDATTVGSGEADVIKAYDSSTGTFTFSRASIPFQGSMNNYCDVYVLVPMFGDAPSCGTMDIEPFTKLVCGTYTPTENVNTFDFTDFAPPGTFSPNLFSININYDWDTSYLPSGSVIAGYRGDLGTKVELGNTLIRGEPSGFIDYAYENKATFVGGELLAGYTYTYFVGWI